MGPIPTPRKRPALSASKSSPLVGRGGLGLVAVAAAVLLLGSLVLARLQPSSAGPLRAGQPTRVTFPIGAGVTGTWGTVLPVNPMPAPITLVSAALVSDGIKLEGIALSNPDDEGGAIGTLAEYPPPGVQLLAVEGAVLSPVGGRSVHLQLLMGVAALSEASGTVEGIWLTYQYEGSTYRVFLPDSLELVPE